MGEFEISRNLNYCDKFMNYNIKRDLCGKTYDKRELNVRSRGRFHTPNVGAATSAAYDLESD